MAKDYAKKYIKYKYLTSRRKNNRYLWIMLGVSICLFILGLFCIKSSNKGQSIESVKKIINKKIESPAPQLPEPKFDFYNILPRENINLSVHADSAMKGISLNNSMGTAIPTSSGQRSINEMLSPTPEQVAIAEAKKQLEQEMGQFNNENYILLLGNFTDRNYAEQFQAQALLKGFPVKKKVSLINGRPVYQIFIGPADFNKLTQEKKRLSEAGLIAILTKIIP